MLAELLEEQAPVMCQRIWELLPVEQEVMHGMYSGAEVFFLLEGGQAAPVENACYLPLPGEVLYFSDAGENVTSRKKATAEICIVYGRGTVLRGPEGVPANAELFARIPGDWMYDWTEFAEACRGVRRQGPQRLRIERA